MIKTINIDKALIEIATKSQATLIQAIGSDKQSLSNSVNYKISKYSIVLTMAEYGIYVDEGTKPHMPPVDGLKEWAASHGLNPWAVAFSISKKGTKAQPFLHKLEPLREETLIILKKAGTKDITAVMKKIFN